MIIIIIIIDVYEHYSVINTAKFNSPSSPILRHKKNWQLLGSELCLPVLKESAAASAEPSETERN